MGTERAIEIEDEALKSPCSRLYLRLQTEVIINCAMGLKHSIDIQALKQAFSNSIMIKHPRFCSLFIIDDKNREHWKKVQVNVDDHFIIHHHHPTEGSHVEYGEAAINEYLADLAVSKPLSKNKPLWDVHVLMGLNCVVLRVHHALGDGASLMSMLSACFGDKKNGFEEAADTDQNCGRKTSHEKMRKWKQKGVWGIVESIWFTVVFTLSVLVRLLWVKDEERVISGGDGVEHWPRKLVTVKFKLEDLKSIRKAIPNATVNDALLGVVSLGLSKYLQAKSPNASRGIQLTSIVPVNLRRKPLLLQVRKRNIHEYPISGVTMDYWINNPEYYLVSNVDTKDEYHWTKYYLEMSELKVTNFGSSSSWGNKTGFVLQPIYCSKGLFPLDHVRKMKAIMDQKKQSYVAQFTYTLVEYIFLLLGPKVANWCCHRMLCNTSLLISNIKGPSVKLAIADNPMNFLRVNVTGQPHAIIMHMVSYAENVDLQIMVAKDVITDPEFLRECLHGSFLDILEELQKN